MATPEPGPVPGREARLLALIVVVSLATLAVLAQFRFPERDATEVQRSSTPRASNPLERLAARATYEELASIVATLERRVDPLLVVLRLVPGNGGSPRFVPGLRVRSDLVLVRLGFGDRPEAIVGDGGTPLLLGLDPLTRLAAVRVPAGPEPAASVEPAGMDEAARYVVVVEGSPGGAVLRPVFLGRTLPFSDPKWDAPLSVLGAALPAQDGALVFSIEGGFAGMAVVEQTVPALAPPEALLPHADRLSRGSPPPPVDLGFEVQELTPALAAAAGAKAGVVVTHVDSRGPAAGILQVTDVLDGLSDQPIASPDGLRVLLARVSPGATARFRLVRGGEELEVSVVAKPPPPEGSRDSGLVLHLLPREGAEVLEVRAGSPASMAGIRPGDLVAYLGSKPAPTPVRIARAFQELAPGGTLVLGVRQQEGHRVVVLRKP